MKVRHLTLVLALAGFAASAQVSQDDHSAHHPEVGAPPAAAAPAPAPGGVAADRYADQIKQMQDMHARMQAARTPRERSALLEEHMKLMQSGMDLMQQMGGMGMGGMGMGGMGMGGGMMGGMQGGGGMPGAAPGMQGGGAAPQAGQGMGGMMGGGMMGMHGAMERRIAMMEMMMQMMVDREAATSGK